MIISASRRTDIPAFYSRWLINRVQAGYCTVPNPFNPKQVSRISLDPADVDVIVFWTRNPAPLLSHLDWLDGMGFRYYFQYTLLDYPPQLEPNQPTLQKSLDTFRTLATRIGSDRVIWRYDPIVFSRLTGAIFHAETYQRIASELKGFTRRSVISLLDLYRKIRPRMDELEKQGFGLVDFRGHSSERFDALMKTMVKSAAENGMEIVSCAEEIDLTKYGIRSGKCIDDAYVKQVFGMDVIHKKDPGQRQACGCVLSQDIGMYDTCLFGCQYCYATSNLERAQANHANHDPGSPSLVGWYEQATTPENLQLDMFRDID